MRDMFKKINAREKLIGWYHSGPKLRASDLEINELFKKYTPNPLLVIVDVQPKEVGVPTDAYFAVDEIKDVSCCVSLLFTWIKKLIIIFSTCRTAQQHPEPSFTLHPSSRLRKRRKLAWSIFSETSEMWPSERFPPG